MRGLSRELWLVEAGVFLNMLGYGAVFPFEVIYLHAGRGFPLGAELAPPALRGRYMAAIGLSWWLGLAVAPTLGTQVPATAALLGGCAVAGAAAVSALALDRRLPAGARATPRPHIARAERV